MNSVFKTALATTVFGVAAGWQVSAYAQEQPSKDNRFVMEEVVITARKREESLQDAPVSVAAFTAGALESKQINTSDQLAQVTPNLTFDANAPASGHSSAAQIYIRGIGQSEFLASSDPGVGLYIDGVYMPRSIGSVINFVDLERIEVLRGPQGTLFGRNTIGGAVVLYSKKPSSEFEGSAEAKIGSDNLLETKLRVSGPLTETLAGSLAIGTKQRDGYVERLQTGEDLGDDNDFGGRAALLWAPTANLEVLLNADYTTEDENGAPLVLGDINTSATFPIIASLRAGCPGATPPGPGASVPEIDDLNCANGFALEGPFATNATGPVESSLTMWGAGLTIDWEPSPALAIKSITSYREMENTALRDADNTPLTILHTSNHDEQNQFSQEFQFTGTTLNDKLDWLLGLYYFEEENDNLTSPVLPVATLQLDGVSETETSAIFSQATYDITDKFSITGGLRWTDETKRYDPDQIALTDFALPSGTLPAGTLLVPTEAQEISIDEITPMVSLSYEWTDDLLTYATYSEGFKSGGFNARNTTPLSELPRFGPEFAKTFEVGVKSDLLDNRLRLNAAAFNTDYSDLQVVFRSGIAPFLFNAGAATIKGFEIEGTFLPTSSWMIDFGLGYIDASYDEVIDPGDAFNTSVSTDSEFAMTPDFAGNLGVGYITEFGDWTFSPRVDYVYTGDKYFDAANTPQLLQEATHVLNASASFDYANSWKLTFGVTNLTDELYLVSGTSAYSEGTGYVEHVYARPRQFSMALQYKW